MYCNICKITNKNLRSEVEALLNKNDGSLMDSDKSKLIEMFPDNKKEIEAITEQDCEMHWNFHQSPTREAVQFDLAEKPEGDESEKKSTTIAGDIGKDEGELLYELANKQFATFNLLTNKINKVIKVTEGEEISGIIVHPTTMQFYKELADSCRASIRELRELNSAINGDKNSANEGLKALAKALLGSPENKEEKEDEQTTNKYDY